ncbi:MAG: hypothetical protein AB9888_16525 [Bacteroidales bacterium]
MKTIILFWIFGMLTATLLAQVDHDYIDRDSFFIVKTSLDVKGDVKKIVSSLRTSLDVESHFGSNYTKNRIYGEMTDSYYIEYTYSDGLILGIPEEVGGKVAFNVTGDAYAMFLSNGSEVRIGMKGDELASIFPDSYANRKAISETRGKEGKTSFIVHLAYTIDNQIHREDAFIRFILNQNTGALEEFYTYEPL